MSCLLHTALHVHVCSPAMCTCTCMCIVCVLWWGHIVYCSPVPLELQEGPPQVTLPSRSRLSFKQHITGLFRPSQTGHQTGQTGSQPGTGGDPPNSQRRSNFFVEPAIREPAIREPAIRENRCEQCTVYSGARDMVGCVHTSY